jgi:hypothetical protein
MKIKICVLLSLVLTVALYVPASEITNSVNITTNINLVFCLAKLKADGAQSQFKSDEIIRYMLTSSSTNTLYLRKFPSGNFDFHLFDKEGKEVLKTRVGLALTGTPPKPTKDDLIFWRTSGFRPFFIGEGDANQSPLFRPDDVFVITNRGDYELEVRTRLYVIMTNGMPDVTAMLDGRNATGHGLPFIKDFGVLTSPPLRVKVIKE